jgi:prophage regulatory protein
MTMRLLSNAELRRKVPLSATQIWRLERRGLFPARIKIGDPSAPNSRVAWDEGEVDAWIADRAAARNQNGENL